MAERRERYWRVRERGYIEGMAEATAALRLALEAGWTVAAGPPFSSGVLFRTPDKQGIYDIGSLGVVRIIVDRDAKP